MATILSADIGGTNSRFARFVTDDRGALKLEGSLWLKTRDYGSFHDLIAEAATRGPISPSGADISVFAVAGPVREESKSSPPFISWDIDASVARDNFGASRCHLINDFIAQAYACLSSAGREARQVLAGTAVANSTAAVIGAGTGLGKAILCPTESGGYTAIPSEGGHEDFPFITDRENEFRNYYAKARGTRHITLNDVVSGRGILNVHKFLSGQDIAPEAIADLPADSETMQWASRFYGRACKCFALDTLATGGLYIAGGVAAKKPELVINPVFGTEFRSSETMAEILGEIPVFLITDEESGLWGGAVYGMKKLGIRLL